MEILGYIFLYLLVGVGLLPFMMLADSLAGTGHKKKWLFIFVMLWPGFTFTAFTIVFWLKGWEELKNYK